MVHILLKKEKRSRRFSPYRQAKRLCGVLLFDGRLTGAFYVLKSMRKAHPDQSMKTVWRLAVPGFLRKEVIQPQVPLRLPCYDFTPVADPTVVSCLLAVSALPSGKTNSHGVTGGVYKARERIHRGVLIRDY